MSQANPLWGAPRIHGELLKLGIDVGQATVSKYMVHHRKPLSQSWRTFLENHATDIVSIDFFTVPTGTSRVLFVFLMMSHARRRVVHFNVTAAPHAAWTGQQIGEAFPWDTAPKYLLRDRDGIYGTQFVRRVLRSCFDYYHGSRTHLGLEKDCPVPGRIEPPSQGPISEEPMIGGLHHRCYRQAA